MKRLHGLRLALASAAALATHTGEEVPRYAPREGSIWERSIELRTVYSLESCLLGVGEGREPWDRSDLVWAFDETLHLATTDVYRSVEDGRPSELRRTFDEAWVELTTEDTPLHRAESALQDRTVEFDWIDEGEPPSVHFVERAGGGACEELPAGLQPDLDFQRWMSTDEVAFGDRWEVPASAMSDWIQPGGDLAFEWGEEIVPCRPGEWRHPGEFDGALTLTWVDEVHEGGERLAVLSLAGEVSREGRFEGMVVEMFIGPVPGRIEALTEYRIEGEMLWDLERGMLRSLSAEARFRWGQRMRPDPHEWGDLGYQEWIFEGTSRLEVRADPLREP